MQTKTSLRKKLWSYSKMAAVLSAAPIGSQAQINYTDIIPDEAAVDYNDLHYQLDLNNDGVIDFVLTGYFGGTGMNAFLLQAESQNAALASTGYSGEAVYPTRLNEGIPIGPSAGSFIQSKTSDAPSPSLLTMATYNWFHGGIYGNWFNFNNEGGDSYLGLRIKLNGENHYGWLRPEVGKYYKQIAILKDYAYNSVPNQPILSGEKDAAICSDIYEPNNKLTKATPIAIGETIHAMINPSGDIDCFTFTVSPLEPNIQIILSDLPKNYDLQLFNSENQKIARSKHLKKENDTIAYNDAIPGNYFAVIYQKDGLFDSENCYSLSLEASPNPYKISSEESSDFSFQLSPIPAHDQLTVKILSNEMALSEIDIYDLLGRIAYHSAIKLDEGDQQMNIPVSALKSGTYRLVIHNDKRFWAKSFVKQ